MPAYKFIEIEHRDRILIITINRPEVMNALSPATNFELAQAFDDFENDDQLWVAIVTGKGELAFSSGGDISEMVGAENHDDYPIPESGYGGITNRFSCDKPIIAAVNGMAFGGGFETALACDLVVASEKAVFGLPEPKIGVAAVGSGMHRLVRDIGLKPAMELLLTGKTIDASQALALNLINQIVAHDEVLAAALKLADKILECAPLAVQATKHCALQGLQYDSLQAAMEAQINGDFPALEKQMHSQDTQEGLRAFMEKRKPQWAGK